MTVITMKGKLEVYLDQITREELSENTILKYSRDIRFFLLCNNDKQILDKKDMIEYKKFLMDRYRINTVNSYLISINRYLSWLGAAELTVKTMNLQRKSSLDGIITLEEYKRLLQYCFMNGRRRDYLLLRTIAATGIRVGELKYITYEAARRGGTEIYSKGKCRSIIIPEELSELLLSYCLEKDITSGIIFEGRKKENALSPKSAWKTFKRIAAGTGVDAAKVYPHNLRHLFAKTYMQKIGNIFELADLLGHSNIETTRVYALSSQEEKRKSLNMLGL